jgi:NADH:ubiquinone oxidoreductase subunit K
MIILEHYLLVGAILFCLGFFCVLTRRNAVAVLMGVELIFNAANLNFVAFARFGTLNIDGIMFAIFIIMLAAAEATVALAIVLNIYRQLDTVNLDEADLMKG